MIDAVLERFQRQGKLRKKEVGFVQIEDLLRESILDLREAKKTADIAERATYLLAYMAMLKAGRSLLLLHGFIPDDGGQHKTVVDVTSVVLGEKYKDLTEHFEIMRRKRNRMTYEAGALLSMSESKQALSDAIMLVQNVLDKVKKLNPQLELPLGLEE